MIDVTGAVISVPEVFEAVRGLIQTASYVLGGIFGIYLILVILRWWQNRIMIRLLKDIKFDLDQQNTKLKLPHSKEMFESKLYRKFKTVFEKEK